MLWGLEAAAARSRGAFGRGLGGCLRAVFIGAAHASFWLGGRSGLAAGAAALRRALLCAAHRTSGRAGRRRGDRQTAPGGLFLRRCLRADAADQTHRAPLGGDVESGGDRRRCTGARLTGLSCVRGTRCAGGGRGGDRDGYYCGGDFPGSAGGTKSAAPALHALLDGASAGPGGRWGDPAQDIVGRAGAAGHDLMETANLRAEAGHDRLLHNLGVTAEPIPELEYDQTLRW